MQRFTIIWDNSIDDTWSHRGCQPAMNWPIIQVIRKPNALPHQRDEFVVVGHDTRTTDKRVFFLWNVTKGRPARTRIRVLSEEEVLVPENYSGMFCTFFHKNKKRMEFVFEFDPQPPAYPLYPIPPHPAFEQQQFQPSAGVVSAGQQVGYHNARVATSSHFVQNPNRFMPYHTESECKVECKHAVVIKREENISSGLPAVTGFPESHSLSTHLLNNSLTNISFNQSAPAGTASGSGSAANSQPKVTQSPKDLVLKAITKDNSVHGISLIELESSLKSLNLKTIKEAIDFLLNEGHIYTTTDDMHFKSLDGYDWSPTFT